MKEQLLLLVSLQEADSELIQITTRRKELPEKIKKLDEDFLVFKEATGKNKRNYDELKIRHTENEGKIKKINDGVVKTKERLLEVKNNKEYQAMLKEIETAESSRGNVEAEIILLLDELDKLAVLVKKDQAIIDEQSRNYEEKKKDMENELNSLDAEAGKWDKKRKELRGAIPADVLAKYDKIRGRSRGIAVISVWKGICNGCHMNLPPQLYNELQKSAELMICPNCNRIIYFQNIDKPA